MVSPMTNPKSRDTVHVIWSTLCLPSLMIAPHDYMAHLESLDKFHHTLQCSPLLSLHRMGLPSSSDSVAKTFLQLLTLPLAIDSSQHCTIIPPMTYEFRFTYPNWHWDFGIPCQVCQNSSDVGIMLACATVPLRKYWHSQSNPLRQNHTCTSWWINWKHVYPIIGWQDEMCQQSNLLCER